MPVSKGNVLALATSSTSGVHMHPHVQGYCPCPCFAMAKYHAGWTDANAALRFHSLLSNLRELTVESIAITLPALQPVAARLRALDIFGSRLQGSSDGFLTKGWTALTSLRLTHTHMENAALTAVLELPALEEVDITGFWHQGASRDQGGVLQLDQLPGSCPNIRGLTFEFSSDMALGTEGRGPCCSFLKLGRLANLCMYTEFDLVPAHLDIDLPASLAGFTVEAGGDDAADLFWVLREAMKCIRGGAQLRTLSCQDADAFLQPAQWGASLHEQYRRLGGQLSTLSELEVWGGTEPLLRALGAVVSSEPHLSCVKVTITRWPPHMELSPICSAGLKSIIVTVDRPSYRRPPPTVVLTFMPGCTRLQHVCVELAGVAVESTEVKIRCHPCSRSCILPVDAHARLADRWYHRRRYGDACKVTEVGVQFLPGPPSPVGAPPGVHGYTVQYACHATGHQQPLKWGHVVMPGLL